MVLAFVFLAVSLSDYKRIKMAEGSAFNSPGTDSRYAADTSQDPDAINFVVARTEVIAGSYESILGDYLIDKMIDQIIDEEQEDMQTASFRTESEKLAAQKPPELNPSIREFTTINELGIVELDFDKLEKKMWNLSLDDTPEVDPSQKEKNVKFLKDKVTDFCKMSEEPEISPQQTEQEKSHSPEEESEEFTEFTYEKKTKLWDRDLCLRKLCEEKFLCKFGDVESTEEDLHNFSNDLLNVESHLPCGVNILRRIAYPKLCERHFSPDFPNGAYAEENEPVENISIIMDHIEFTHKELSVNFLELFKKDFNSIAIDWEKTPEINNFLPSFRKFLISENKFEFPLECFNVILAILKNPHRKFEFFYDAELPVVKEQTAIAEYLLSCLRYPNFLADEVVSEKLANTIITFANVHPSFLAKIIAGFTLLLSDQEYGELIYLIYCKVLNIMTSIGALIISQCLPQHFKRISCLASNDQNCELYFHLLKACEILIADAMTNELHLETSDEIDLNLFYSDCYNYFGSALTNRLIPVFRKYEKRKHREEQYLSKKHSIFPTKNGYMDTELCFLANKYNFKKESLNYPKVKECPFNPAGKYLSSSSVQLGYIIQEDKLGLSGDDLEYWNLIDKFPTSYLEAVLNN